MPRTKRQSGRTPSREKLFEEILGFAASAGIPPAEFALHSKKCLKLMPDQDRALTNYHRFLQAGFTTSLIRDFHAHPVLEEILLQLAAQSQYLADILVRTPELLHWLTASGVLVNVRSREEYLQEAAHAIAPFERNEKRLNALKRFQRRELLRLGAREILREAPGQVVAAELASLADAVVETVLGIAREEVRSRSGNAPSDLAVIGLGKLGGEELNFSSDIDMMFVYERDEDFPSELGGTQSAHQLHARIVESTVRMLSEHTPEGYLYRVDLRLRPDGQAGPLAMSRAATMTYYESRGELWERQMLIKARPIAGDAGIGASFLNDIRPFVYPRTHLRSPLDEILAIKQKIEQKVGGSENLKLGAGGIRDIEFIVQGLLMVHGGANIRLRERGTLIALERLRSCDLISAKDEKELREAYIFLRSVEHRLQLLEGRQTHSLPETENEMITLARRLGFASSALFRVTLARHRTAVRRAFERMFTPNAGRRGAQIGGRATDPFHRLIEEMGLRRTTDITERLESLKYALPSIWESPVRESFAKAFKAARGTMTALERFGTLASMDSIRRTLSAALANPRFVELLVRVCATSGSLSRLLADEPLLFETLAGRPEEMLGRLHAWLFLRESDPSRFKTYNEARILLRFLMGIVPLEQMLTELSELAEDTCRQSFEVSFTETAMGVESRGLVLVALGKLGGKELTVGSDLDLLFLLEGTPDALRTKTESAARKFLSTVTSGNPPTYHADLRLRPEGKNAPLVSTLAYFREYFGGRAQLWERQSLLRARTIAGPEERQKTVSAVLQAIAYDTPLPDGWATELRTMRDRIEKNRGSRKPGILDLKTVGGGLLDIEFVVQALQLRHGSRIAAIRDPSVISTITVLGTYRLLLKGEARILADNYRWLRTLELFIKMNSVRPEFLWPVPSEVAEIVAVSMGERSPATLTKRLKSVLKQNRAIFTSLLKRLGRPDEERSSTHR